MPSIADKLNELIAQRAALVANLIAKGVNATTAETFNSLISKVDSITGGAAVTDKKLYSFGVVSDIHLKDTTTGPDTNASLTDYQRALEYFAANGAEFVCVPGDIVSNNHSTDGSQNEVAPLQWMNELTAFKTISDTYFPDGEVYAVTGNHDATPFGHYTQVGELGLGALVDAYGDGTNTAEEVYEILTGRELNYVVLRGDDVFIFLSMYDWDYRQPVRAADLTWLETQLETYADNRVFLFFHIPLPDTLGLPSSASTLLLLAEPNVCTARDFRDLINQYPNVIWFNGHTHYRLNYESETYPTANIYKGAGPTSVHCPSCAYTRSAGDPYTNNPAESEGYIVDVYTNSVVLNGIDFTKIGTGDEHIFAAHYILS